VRGAAAWTATALLAATEAFGAETAAFLRLQPDARAAGMGEALTAASEGLSAFTVNPAGLALKPAREAGFSHSALYEATRLHQLSYAQPAGQDGAAGVSVRRLTHGGLEGRDAARARTGSFTAADTAVTAAYARKAAPGLVAGAALSYVDSQLADTHGRGVAGDLGVVWSREEAGLPVALGAAARNLGPGLKRDREREALPATLAFGAAVRPTKEALLAADLRWRPEDAGSEVSLGGEYAVIEQFRLRAGYALRNGADSGGAAGLGAGFGLSLSQFALDYAFSPYGELGNAQRVTLRFRF
jgi:hypothetical protein